MYLAGKARRFVFVYILTGSVSDFGGLEVASWPLVPTFAGSQPAEAVGFLGRKKIFSTPSFGGEVKPSVPCRSFTYLLTPWSRVFLEKLTSKLCS